MTATNLFETYPKLGRYFSFEATSTIIIFILDGIILCIHARSEDYGPYSDKQRWLTKPEWVLRLNAISYAWAIATAAFSVAFILYITIYRFKGTHGVGFLTAWSFFWLLVIIGLVVLVILIVVLLASHEELKHVGPLWWSAFAFTGFLLLIHIGLFSSVIAVGCYEAARAQAQPDIDLGTLAQDARPTAQPPSPRPSLPPPYPYN